MLLPYSPLSVDKSEIRLLTIFPGAEEDELRCSLSVVSLFQCPKYEALSYLWGDQKITKDIIVDGVSLRVTASLERALRCLRHPTMPRVIWVDALCMNQDDVTEKNHQIPLMYSIYKDASDVVAWLGNSNTDLEYLASWARVYFSNLPRYFSWKWIKMVMWSWISKQGELEKAISNIRLYVGRQALESHPYFTRMWTFQEFMVPVRTPTFLIGRKAFRIEKYGSTDYSTIHKSLETLKQNGDPLKARTSAMWKARAQEIIRIDESRYFNNQVVTLFQMKLDGNKLHSIFTFCLLTASRDCFDCRDKIFALYGLLQETYLEFPKPDYTKAPELVLLETISYCVKYIDGAHLPLFMSLWALRPSRITDTSYPSWLPDLTSQTPGPTSMNWAMHFQSVLARAPLPAPEISDDLQTLKIETRIIGKCRRIFRFTADPDHNMKTVVGLVCPNRRGTSLLETWKSTLRSKKDLSKRFAIACYYHDLGSHFTVAARLLNLLNAIAKLEDLSDLDILPWSDAADSLLYLVRGSIGRLANKTLFQTEDGLFGICSPELKDGDLIARSPWFPMPLAIRQRLRSDGDFQDVASFVGWAFVDGLMGYVDQYEDGKADAGQTIDEELQRKLQDMPPVMIYLR